MKKLFFAILMCVAAMSAKAQVLTSETVNHIYSEAVSDQRDFCRRAALALCMVYLIEHKDTKAQRKKDINLQKSNINIFVGFVWIFVK